jgi:phosphatidate cytidylyltransferase
MADLSSRLMISISVGICVATLIVFSLLPFVSFLLMLFVAGISATGVWEYTQLAIAKKRHPATRLMIAIAILEVIALYISLVFVDLPQLPILVVALGIITFFIHRFKRVTGALNEIAIEFFGIVYVAVPLSLILGVLYPSPHQGFPQEGRWWLLYLIVVTKITDVSAYFVGRLWGKNKLCPSLSPQKTVEGAIAGFIGAVCTSIVIHKLAAYMQMEWFHLSFSESIWLGMLIGILGQVGDLAESLLKRDAVVKDSNTLPGLGGVLDMVDSLLFTTPVVYFFLRMH